MENSLGVSQKVKHRTTVARQFHSWGEIQKNSQQGSEQVSVHPCSQQHYPLTSKGANEPHVHQQMNGQTKKWNIHSVECYLALKRKEILLFFLSFFLLSGKLYFSYPEWKPRWIEKGRKFWCMLEQDELHARWKKPSHKRTNIVWSHLCEIPTRVKFRDRTYNRGHQGKWRVSVKRAPSFCLGWRRGSGNGQGGGRLYNTVNVRNANELCT